MISTRSITSATACLRQAYELAIQIDAMDSFAPDKLIDQHRRQFQSQVEQLAARLGFRLDPNSKPHLVSSQD
jgi:hypothetical protein